MPNFSERYRACKEQVKEISRQTPQRVGIALVSIALAILLMMGPIVVFVNCFIFLPEFLVFVSLYLVI